MRKYLVTVVVAIVCSVVCFAGGRLSNQPPASAEGSGMGAGDVPVPPCQDANGDGQSDVSDGIFLLSWLFLGGPEPECPVSNGTPVGLPDTGQATCYDAAANVTDCASDICAGQDGFYQTGCSNEDRFTDNGDGTVTDNCTGLMWQKDTGNDGNPLINWCDALAYCEDLELAGHDDWRLPNVRELQSIVDYGPLSPAIDAVFDALPSFYWSSTSNEGDPDSAWGVDFSSGSVSNDDKGWPCNDARAVRTIQPGE